MSKIARGKSNCENLFSKIAEPNPIFYKDRKSRMQKQIYLHFPEAEFFKTTQKMLGDRKALELSIIYRFIARNRSRTEQRNRNRPGLIPESITIPKAARSNFKHGIIAVSGAFWMRNGPSPFRRKGARKGRIINAATSPRINVPSDSTLQPSNKGPRKIYLNQYTALRSESDRQCSDVSRALPRKSSG